MTNDESPRAAPARRRPPGSPSRSAAPPTLALLGALALAGSVAPASSASAADDGTDFDLAEGDRVVLIGNTFAERMQHFGHFETRLQLAHPEFGLTLRNLGWSGDEVDLMPRPLNFGTLEEHLAEQDASAILMCFGANESFAGEAGLNDFRTGLEELVDRLEGKTFDGRAPVRLVLVSPTAHERLPPPFPDATPRNEMLERYTGAMAEFAARRGLPFVDLFHPTFDHMADHPDSHITINGIHFTDEGYSIVAGMLGESLGFDPSRADSAAAESLRRRIVEKNEQFFRRWRPLNAEYVYGRRREPFGVVTFPPEMTKLDRIVAELDEEIQAEARRLSSDDPSKE